MVAASRLGVATCDGDGDGLPMGWNHVSVEKSTIGYGSFLLGWHWDGKLLHIAC